jgi:hypothetical protein
VLMHTRPAEWPYAASIGAEDITLLMAERARLLPPPPWRAVGDGRWTAARSEVEASFRPHASAQRPSDWYVALGSDGPRLVLLDLAPTVCPISVSGDPLRRANLVRSLLAQFASVPGHRTLIADEVVPQQYSTPLGTALDALDHVEPVPTLIACAAPAPQESIRLQAALLERAWLKALILGETKGSNWPISVDADGVVRSRPLGLLATSSGLPERVGTRPVAEEDAVGDVLQAATGASRSAGPSAGLDPLAPYRVESSGADEPLAASPDDVVTEPGGAVER